MILTLCYWFLCLVDILYSVKPLPIRVIGEPFEIISVIWIHNDLSSCVPGEPIGSQVWHEALLLMLFIQFRFALFFYFLLCFELFPLNILNIRFFELAHSTKVSFWLRKGRELSRIGCFQILLLPFNDSFKHYQTRPHWSPLFSSKLIDSL